MAGALPGSCGASQAPSAPTPPDAGADPDRAHAAHAGDRRAAGALAPVLARARTPADPVEDGGGQQGYRGFQDERGRLWDVLWMARHYALRASNRDRVRMCVLVRDIRKDLRDSNRPPRRHFPIVAIGAGDDGGPTITIMFAEDD